MPLYEYCCSDCNNEFDSLRTMSKADAPIACPECKCMDARRKLSRFAAMSRGNGGESRSVAGSGGCSGCSGRCGGTCSGCSHH